MPQNNPQFQPGSNFQQIKGLYDMMKSGGSAEGMVQAALMRNPNYASVMSLVNQYGGDAQAAFYAKAKEMGVDPNSILKMLG